MNENASPAGTARITRTVRAHLVKYGPIGVPNGLVDAQNCGQGSTPCRPHSLINREEPRRTAMRLPNELSAMRKLRPRTAPWSPNTFVKRRPAAIVFPARISSLGIAAKYATLARMYKMATSSTAPNPLFRMLLTGFLTSLTTLNAFSYPASASSVSRYRG